MRALVAALVTAALVAGCGGNGSSSQTEDTAAATVPVQPATTAPPSTSATTVEPTTTVVVTTTDQPTTTVAADPMAELTVLRPDGIGEVDFGTAADEALAALSSLLGPPDRVETIDALGLGGDGCVEGATWLQCLVSRRVVETGRLAVWDTHGLEVAMVDTTAYGREVTMAEQFGDWHATVPADGTRLITDEGLHPAMTVGELRQAVPGLEFHYNEGLLDSFYVDLGDRGGYGGRLDWDPTTGDIEWGDVGAVQSALNRHGADLEVDGVWGPLTEVAWTEFLSSEGIESVPPQLWLTPEIGTALGLPPDDITVATIEPRPPLDPATPTATEALPILRADGLGQYDFGQPADGLIEELASRFGAPAEQVVRTAELPQRLQLPYGYHAAHEIRFIQWDEPDLRVIVSDVPFHGDHVGEPVSGTLHLMSWATTSSSLRLDSGVGVTSTLAELRRAYPSTHVGEYDFQCGNDFGPNRFRTGVDVDEVPRGWLDVRGELEWDWVTEVQRALNERGATLDVDGIYGPKTRAAVTTFQESNSFFANGLMNPETADALDLEASEDAHITRLEAGYPGSC